MNDRPSPERLAEIRASYMNAPRGFHDGAGVIGELLTEIDALRQESKDHAEWAREYGKTPNGQAMLLEVKCRMEAEAELSRLATVVAQLREALIKAERWITAIQDSVLARTAPKEEP